MQNHRHKKTALNVTPDAEQQPNRTSEDPVRRIAVDRIIRDLLRYYTEDRLVAMGFHHGFYRRVGEQLARKPSLTTRSGSGFFLRYRCRSSGNDGQTWPRNAHMIGSGVIAAEPGGGNSNIAPDTKNT